MEWNKLPDFEELPTLPHDVSEPQQVMEIGGNFGACWVDETLSLGFYLTMGYKDHLTWATLRQVRYPNPVPLNQITLRPITPGGWAYLCSKLPRKGS